MERRPIARNARSPPIANLSPFSVVQERGLVYKDTVMRPSLWIVMLDQSIPTLGRPSSFSRTSLASFAPRHGYLWQQTTLGRIALRCYPHQITRSFDGMHAT